MAFTGVAVVKQITDGLVRITGVSLAADASGSIGLFGDAGADVQLPDAFNPKPYDYPPVGNVVSLSDSVRVTVLEAAASPPPAGAVAEAMFYGLTAGTGNPGATDYAATVAVDAAVPFPRLGPTTGGGIVPGGLNQFVLPVTGIYEVSWAVEFLEASQLLVKLNAAEVPHSLAFSGAGTQQNTNTILIEAVAGDLLSICNASGNVAALTVQTADGSHTHAQAPSLVIKQVSPTSGGGAADVSVVKAAAPFRVSVVNNDLLNVTAGLEIYVGFHL